MTTSAPQIRRAKPASVEQSIQTNGAHATDYDSAEFPVLIRLPDLATLTAFGTTREERPPRPSSIASDPPAPWRQPVYQVRPVFVSAAMSASSRYLTGAIAVGLMMVALLFFTNGRRPATHDGVPANAQTALIVQEPALASTEAKASAPDGTKPINLYPGFVYESPGRTLSPAPENDAPPLYSPTREQTAARSSASAVTRDPQLELASNEKEVAGTGSAPQPYTTPLWSSPSTASSAPVNAWPDEAIMAATPGAAGNANASAEIAPNASNGIAAPRPGLNGRDAEAYRTGRLDSRSPAAPRDSRQNILDGTIEIPSSTSIR